MAEKLLESGAISTFCESVAVMLAAGIQTDEAIAMIADSAGDVNFKRVCDKMYRDLVQGVDFATAMRRTKAFPKHAVDTVAVGITSGRLENVMHNLGEYYNEEDRVFTKIKSSIGYPAALLCIMTVILAFTVAIILPVFVDVYENLSGDLASGSFAAVRISTIIGWIALIITLVCTVFALIGAFWSRSEEGRQKLLKFFEKIPATKDAMYQLAVSRFAGAIATYTASGIDSDNAMKEALATVEHDGLRAKLRGAYAAMTDVSQAKTLAQAISDADVLEPIYARMLVVGSRSGNFDRMLSRLSQTFFDDSIIQVDRMIDNIEPTLAAFLTIAVGATLIAVMLPLISIMGSIG